MASEEEPTPSTPKPQLENPLVAERLFHARTILLFGEINAVVAERTVSQLLALAAAGPEPIQLFLHSPGGHVESGDSLYDVIRFIAPEVRVIGSGWVASAGALIYAATPREQRYALPNTRFLLHEPSGGMRGSAADVEIEARQILQMRARLNAIYAQATGQTEAKIARDTERNHWMSAREALDYGLVGRIVERAAEVR